jgi:hypothetical protein
MIASQWDNRKSNFFYLALRGVRGDGSPSEGLPLRLRIAPGGVAENYLFKTEMDDGTLTSKDQGWMHLAFTLQAGGAVRLYKNGEEVDADELRFDAPRFPDRHNQPLLLGALDRSYTNNFDGWMDELAIFDAVFSQEEIRTMYAAGVPAAEE